MSETEQIILNRASRGDPEAFRTLAERHQDMVFAACHRVLGNMNDAEDASQEVFLQLLRKINNLRAPIAGWLHHVATQVSINLLRQKQARIKRDVRAAQERPAGKDVSWEEIEGIVDEAIAYLPDDLRLPIVMHYLEGQRLADIGRELQISESAVSKRLTRGISAMQAQMRKRGRIITLVAIAGLLSANAAEAMPATLAANLGKIALASSAQSAKSAAVSTGLRITVTKLIIAASMVAAATGTTFALIAYSNRHATASAATLRQDPRENPDTAVAEAIRLLEAREYATFAQEFMPPETLTTILAIMTLDEFAEDFGKKSADDLLQVLRALAERTPALSEDSTAAIYTLDESIGGRSSFQLVKIGRYWYIPNR